MLHIMVALLVSLFYARSYLLLVWGYRFWYRTRYISRNINRELIFTQRARCREEVNLYRSKEENEWQKTETYRHEVRRPESRRQELRAELRFSSAHEVERAEHCGGPPFFPEPTTEASTLHCSAD